MATSYPTFALLSADGQPGAVSGGSQSS